MEWSSTDILNDRTEPNDKFDNPKYETESIEERIKYWEELDDRARWAE